MQNLKIKCEPKDNVLIQKLFIFLGAQPVESSIYIRGATYLYLNNGLIEHGGNDDLFNQDSSREVTLSELKIMVESKLAIEPFKEYLVFNGDGVFYATNQGEEIHGTCYEIPAGAEFATGIDSPVFRKDGFCWDKDNLNNDDTYWYEASTTLTNAESRGFKILWVRGSQPKQSLNDIAKTVEDHRQSLMVRPEDAPIELTTFGYFPDPEPDLYTAINDLFEEFGFPPGAHRMSWLRQQLVTAKRATESQSGDKEPVTIDRETARHRLAMMFRGEATRINDHRIKFDDHGFFVAWNGPHSGSRAQSLKATLDYLFK